MEKSGCGGGSGEDCIEEEPPHSPGRPAIAGRVSHPGRIVWAVPFEGPTFLAGPRLKETCRREKAARAGARGSERVTASHFNPIRIIVKLRNTFKKRERRGRKNRRAAR